LQTVDASSVIHAWDTYPIGNFPKLWEWVAEQINDGKLDICRVAYDAIARKTPDCGTWLQSNGFKCFEITNAIAQEALRIKAILGIRQRFSAKGVDENDLLIIGILILYPRRGPNGSFQPTWPIGESPQCADMLMSG